MHQWYKTVKLKIRFLEKYLLHRVFLPIIYQVYRKQPVQKKLVLFADAKNDKVPFSMQAMYEEMQRQGYQVENWCINFDEISIKQKLRYLYKFMKRYTQAKYVFICDYFLPVSSCEKKLETKVIQLWHSCGLLKKFAYDASDDLGAYGSSIHATKNIDLWPVSSEACVPVFEKATHLYDGQIQALGVARTDIYFSEIYRKQCIERFYSAYPELKGKKLILWAPTFRDNAKTAALVGAEDILRLQGELGDDWKVLIKVHPHLAKKYQLDNCKFPTEQLYPVIDLLITDYSSVVFDYMLFDKPFLIYALDYEEYIGKRGCYIDLEKEMPGGVVREYEKLVENVREYETSVRKVYEKNDQFYKKHLSCCQGNTISNISHIMRNL